VGQGQGGGGGGGGGREEKGPSSADGSTDLDDIWSSLFRRFGEQSLTDRIRNNYHAVSRRVRRFRRANTREHARRQREESFVERASSMSWNNRRIRFLAILLPRLGIPRRRNRIRAMGREAEGIATRVTHCARAFPLGCLGYSRFPVGDTHTTFLSPAPSFITPVTLRRFLFPPVAGRSTISI